jgi:hypothetical protein
MQSAFGNPKDKNPLDLVGSVGWYEFHLGAAQLTVTVESDQIVALGTSRCAEHRLCGVRVYGIVRGYSAQQDPTPVALKPTEILYHISTNLLPACKLVLSCLVL